jgi:peptidoglycan/LPS O-acetylase OafA/YrhL
MLAHFGSLLPGGFLGVDIFFIISGFVITLSVMRLWESTPSIGEFLREFWKRRFFRLVPVLVVVLLTTLVAASLTLPPTDFGDQVEMSVWSLFFAGNIGAELVSQSDYFDPGAQYNWFLHLWSLGVEEQFYLAFPILFVAVVTSSWARSRVLRPVWIISFLAVVSFLLAVGNEADIFFGWGGVLAENPRLSALLGYYSPISRAWQLLLGVLAALIVLPGGSRRVPGVSAFALAALAVSLLFSPESNLLPGLPTLFPMLAVFLFLLFPLPETLAAGRWLTPVRWLGDRSYSAYLWHWPVWLYVDHHIVSQTATILLSFVTTFLLSALTYRWVELPFIRVRHFSLGSEKMAERSQKHKGKVGLVLWALLPLPFIFGFGVLGIHQLWQGLGYLPDAPGIPRIDETRDCAKRDCSAAQIDVLLIGDSHAGALAPAFQKELEGQGLELRVGLINGCLHLPSTSVESIDQGCQARSAEIRNLVATISPPIVVVHGYTAGRFTTINSGGPSSIQLLRQSTGQTVTEATAITAYRESLEETLNILTLQGAQVVVVSGVPDFPSTPNDLLWAGKPASQAQQLRAPWVDFEFGQTITKDQYLARHGPFREIERSLADSRPSVTWVDPWPSICQQDTCAQYSEEGVYIYADQDHLSSAGATQLARALVIQLLREGITENVERG